MYTYTRNHPDFCVLQNLLPLLFWGAISGKGYAEVTMHKKKKLTVVEWAKALEAGKLTGAIKTLKPGTMDPKDFLTEAQIMKKLRSRSKNCD